MPDIQDSTHVDPSWELPWGVAYLQGNDDSVQLMDQGGIPVLEVLGGDDEHSALEDGDTLPKAQFIVRAVNNHERLLAALEAMTARLEAHHEVVGHDDEDGGERRLDLRCDTCQDLNGARAAIAAAKVAS